MLIRVVLDHAIVIVVLGTWFGKRRELRAKWVCRRDRVGQVTLETRSKWREKRGGRTPSCTACSLSATYTQRDEPAKTA
jgi:hypothetical protein